VLDDLSDQAEAQLQERVTATFAQLALLAGSAGAAPIPPRPKQCCAAGRIWPSGSPAPRPDRATCWRDSPARRGRSPAAANKAAIGEIFGLGDKKIARHGSEIPRLPLQHAPRPGSRVAHDRQTTA
jgi:hypothetical protein